MLKRLNSRRIVKSRSWLVAAAVAISLSAGLYFSRAVSAMNIGWDGGGITNNWSEAANWSGDTVPGPNDVAVFDGTSTKDATVDVNINVQGIQINTGYTGTITQATGAAITIGGSAFNQAAGTFNGSSNTITINSNGAGAFTQSGGTFNGGSGDIRLTGDANANHNFELTGGTFNSTSGTLFLDRSFVHNSGTGTFNHNNGTVTFNGNQNPSFQGSAAGETFNNLNFSKDDGTGVSFFSNIVVVGTLALNDGSLSGSSTIEARAGLSIASTFDGGNITLAIANGGGVARTFTFAAGANLPNILLNDPDVTINTSGSGTFNWHQLILQQGVINQGGVDFNFFPPGGGGEPFKQSGGTFNGSSHPITFNSGGFGALTQSGGTFNGGSGDLHLIGDANANHNFELTGGTFNSTSGTLFLARGFIHNSGSGTFNHNNGTVTFDSSQNPDIEVSAAGETFNNLNFSKDNGTAVSIFGKVIVVGALALNDGSLSGATVEARAGVTIASTFDGGNVTLAIANGGGVTRTITFAAGANLPNILLNDPDATINTSGSGVLNWRQVILQQGVINQGTVDCNFFTPVSGGESFNQSGGTFNGSSNTITFNSSGAGAFTQSGGTFNGGSGDLHLIGDANANHNFELTGGTFKSTSGTLFLARSFIHNSGSGTFNHNNGTVTFNSNQNPTIQVSAAGETFNNLNFSKDNGTAVSIFGKVIVVGALVLNDGSLSGGTLESQGNVTIASTFDGGNPAFTFTGSANQIFTNNSGPNPTGTWEVNKTSGKVTLASNLILNGSQLLNITSGTLDQGASFNLQTSNTLTIGAAGTLRDFGTGDLTLGGSLVNNGTLNFNGGGTGCSDPNVADQILIRSTAAGTTRAWSGSGAFSVVDVDVQDQDASAIVGGITAFGSSVINNSPGWATNAGCPITVTTQPNNVSACPGSPASFTAAVSGTGPTFQWRKNGAPLSNGGNISGATTATLTINPVGAADVASAPGYDAIGTNSFGVTATTAAATLSLKSAPAITADPTVTTVCAGQSASFSASATGNGITFHWRRNGAPLANGGAISGADTPTLTINPTVAGDDANYDLMVTGDCTPPAFSSAAHLTVNTAPAITTQASDQEVCAAGSASFAVATSGTGLSFQWRRNGVNLNDGGNLSGAHTATLTISPAAAGDAATAGAGYDVIVGGACNPAVTSIRRALTIDDAPAIGTQPADQEVTSGAAASFSVAATGASLNFQWRRNGTNLSDGGNISGAHTATLTINPVGAGDAAVAGVGYDVVVSGTCSPTTTSARRALTVDAPSAANGEVSGRITTTDGAPLSGVVIRLTGTQNRKTITDSDGNYRFGEVETSGFYTVVPARTDYVFSPATRSFSQLGNQTESAFTASSSGVTANPLDTPEYFVRQQYLDVLGREPDEGGLNYWSDQLLACGDANCIRAQRIGVAAAFFIEPEAQQTGSYIYDLYAGTLNRKPAFAEYSVDRQQVVGGANLEAQKTAFAQSFVQRAEFAARYQSETTAESFVDALLQNVQSSGGDLSGERARLISTYNAGANLNESRASVLRTIADNAAFKQTQYNSAFVLTEYFGYLRRDAETDGFNFWLNVLNNDDPQNYRGMVCSFITSAEYQRRFSSVVSHSNAECGQ